jgi:heat shock protein HslJ
MKRIAPLALAAALAGTGCNYLPVNREPPPLPFTGTKWMLITERTLQTPPYLEFGDGAVTGFGGCNRVMGRYQQDSVGAGSIVFTSIASARMMCDPVLMTIEDKILAVLRSSTSVYVKGNTLQLDGSAGTLRFVAFGTEVPPPTSR